MEIRLATTEDAELIHSLVQLAFEEYRDALPVSVGALDETLAETYAAIATGQVLLALDGSIPVGTVRYEIMPDHLYVGRLAVPPTYRRRGIGAALMSHVEHLALSLGQTNIQLGTRESIPSNISFYEGLGYRVVERVPHPRGPDIVVWFEKALSPE